MRFVRVLESCFIISLLSSLSKCRVLIAGDEETFKRLARNYVPNDLADKLTDLVAQANHAAAEVPVEQAEYINPQGPDQVQNKEYINAEGSGEDGNLAQFRNQPGNIDEMQPRHMQVNLDQLVEKVRSRLLDELTSPNPDEEPTTLLTDLRSGSLRPQPNVDASNVPGPSSGKKKPRQSVKPSLTKHLYKEPIKRESEEVESHGLYEKIAISKPKNKERDSYEDYVKKIPKMEYDVFETEEVGQKKRRPRPKDGKLRQGPGRKSTPREPSQSNKENNNNEYDKNPLESRIFIIDSNNNKNDEYGNNPNNPDNNNNNNDNKNNDYGNNPNIPNSNNNNDNYNNNNYNNNVKRKVTIKSNHYNNNKPNRNDNEQKNEPTVNEKPEEYVDDDFITHSTTTFEPKAATEFIGGNDDYKDYKDYARKTTTEGNSKYPLKKKPPKRIVTNMPIRPRYKIVTPNYYGKLPRIAEKYNFDEPIPEKDREEEVYKHIGPMPSNINGKVKV